MDNSSATSRSTCNINTEKNEILLLTNSNIQNATLPPNFIKTHMKIFGILYDPH